MPFLYKWSTEGFRTTKLTLALPHIPGQSAPPSVLSGPFTYIGRGSQAFVFGSQDGKYVLKLFRRERQMHPWRKALQGKKAMRKKKKYRCQYTTCKLAFEKAKDLTGLIYIHTNRMNKSLPVWIGSQRIDLDRYLFVIQERGTPLKEDLAKLQRLKTAFVSLVEERVRRGIKNTDPKVSRNFGFCGDRIIEWDFGKYKVDPTMNPEEEINRFTQFLQ